MKFLEYVKDNFLGIIIYIITIGLILLIIFAFDVPKAALIIIFVIFFICGVSILIINFSRKNEFYKLFMNNLEALDRKYLVLETVDEPTTYEAKLMVDALYVINKSMLENVRKSQDNIDEFREFVEMWIHEVKIPISSMVLKCHNNKGQYDKSFLSLIRRLDNNIDEILYYVRTGDTEKDFVISEINLREIIRNISMKNKDDLLDNNISFKVELGAINVNSDKKWLEFIINQIINNSIKYKKDTNSVIIIQSYEDSKKVVLEIYDNGIGIPQKDLKRVFDKTFTGTNGRDKVKSTGMGLYIIKKLCNKLGHNIYIESIENKYTKVVLEFGKNNIYEVIN